MKQIVSIAAILFSLSVCGAHAFEIEGEYTYAEKGYTGSLTIAETHLEPRLITVNLNTVENKTAHTCSLDAVGDRMKSPDGKVLAVFIAKDENGADVTDLNGNRYRFTITFTPHGAKIDNFQGMNAFCGMGGRLSGSYKKDSSRSDEASREDKATEVCSGYVEVKKECFHSAARGVSAAKGLKSVKKGVYDDALYNAACQDGYASFGRAGKIKESQLNQALQSDYARCYEDLMNE